MIDAGGADDADELVAVADDLAVDLDDDVVLLDAAGLGGGRVGLDAVHADADRIVDTGRAAVLIGDGADHHAHVAVDDLAAFLEVVDGVDDLGGDGHGEADAVGALLREDDGGVDADHFAVQVEERAAAVAGINLGGGLNEIAVEAIFFLG